MVSSISFTFSWVAAMYTGDAMLRMLTAIPYRNISKTQPSFDSFEALTKGMDARSL